MAQTKTSRRMVLQAGLGLAATTVGMSLPGCAGRQVRATGRAGDGIKIHMSVDRSFARHVLNHASAAPDALLKSNALAALVRHARMTGRRTGAGALLKTILKRNTEPARALPVLRAWRGRDDELLRYARAAGRYMPPAMVINGTIFFVTGYDIGVASPPDVAINVAHPRFIADPAEVGHYVTHEVHHLGFLARRKMPPLRRLNDPNVIRNIISFMTQMEGMAVHAAYPGRKAAGALSADKDYAVYQHKDAAQKAASRYVEIRSILDGKETLSGAEIGAVLGAMSSGERLWYRVGALAARRLEQRRGRAALVKSIEEPGGFREALEGVLGLPGR